MVLMYICSGYIQHSLLFFTLSTLVLRVRAAAVFIHSTTSSSKPITATFDTRSILLPCSRATTTTNRFRIIKMNDDNNNNNDKGNGELYLFDFDGVVCDSCDECTVSALRTIQKIKATTNDSNNALQQQLDYPPPWLFDKMREIRPAIEVGWQIPILLDIILEQHEQQKDDDSASQNKNIMSIQQIMSNYEQLVEDWLKKYQKTEQEMVDAFGKVRDAWIQNDMTSWLEINKFYPGVPQALCNCDGKVVLVTTKQQRFATALCRHAGVHEAALPVNDIYGLGMYTKKSDVIVDRMTADNGYYYAPIKTSFFEDRWPTLVKCLADTRLQGVKFYLCSWGYVTQDELDLAKAEPRVKVITLEDFATIVTSSTS